jgi:hypothetical protein
LRFLIAAGLLVLSLLALLFGIAERTVWAPPANHIKAIELDGKKPLILVPNEVLRMYPGIPKISAQGAKGSFISTGRESDVRAWIGAAGHQSLEIDPSGTELVAVSTEGIANLDKTAGSDLWRTESASEDNTSTSLRAFPSNNAAALIASDGIHASPTSLTIVWPIKHDLIWSNIALLVGGVLLLAALIMNLLAYQHMRISRGPRRRTPSAPKPPKYRVKKSTGSAPVRGRRSARRSFAAIPVVITILATGTGCTAVANPNTEITASPSPSASTIELPPVALVDAQITKILNSLEKVAADADLTSDKKLLVPRFAGPALEQRTAHYVLRARSSSVAALPKIVGSPVSFSLPAATDTWPRTLMVVTDEPGTDALPQMLVFQQENPRANYLLWYNMRLMPGAVIPEVPATDVGAIPVATDSLFLKLVPTDIPAAYGDVINEGPASLSYGLFDTSKDEFYKQVSESQKSQVEGLTKGKITFTHQLGNKNVISLATSTAGALVAVYMTDTYKITPKTRGSAVAVSGQEKIMLGADGSTRGVRSIYGEMLLFYVPALSDPDRIRLLGVTQGLLSVRSL